MYKTFSKLFLVVVPVLFFILSAQSAQAATFVVNSTADTGDFSFADGVCDTNDSANDGPCTLRAAITQANATAGHDTITFSVTGTITSTGVVSYTLSDETGVTITGPGSGSLTIDTSGMTPSSYLGNTAAMHISGDNNIISGFTLRGSTIGIWLNGSNDNTFTDVAVINNSLTNMRLSASSGTEFDAMTFSNAGGEGLYLTASSANNTVSNSTFSNNTTSGLFIDSGNNNTITGNTFSGTGSNAMNIYGPTGTLIQDNTITGFHPGILIGGATGATTVNHNTISGSSTEAVAVTAASGVITITNNTLTGNAAGIGLVTGTSSGEIIDSNTITGNQTGINMNATATNVTITRNTIRNNSNYGISSTASGVTITDNTISGQNGNANSAGLHIGGSNYVITGNRIGTNASGVITAGYENTYGIFVNAFSLVVSNILIGGTSASDKNIIAGNTTGGILGLEWASRAVTFSSLGNSIYGNGVHLGNDLASIDGSFVVHDQGVTANDVGDADTGANGLLNTPVIRSADSAVDLLDYTLDVPAGTYRVEFFRNPTTNIYGEGQTFIGYDTFTSTGVSKTITALSLPIESGDYITATATQDLGGGNYGATSEFSQAYSTYPVAVAPAPSTSGGVVSVVRVCNDPHATNYSTGAGFGDPTSCVYGPATSVQTPATSPALSCPVFVGNYKRGAQGAPVVKIQAFLNAEVNAGLPTNGSFGPLTEKAVKAFQTKYAATILGGIAPTGNWYKNTTAQANVLSGCK